MPPSPKLKRCHTCRRRRRKCDGSQPHCQRCFADGFECLGYEKLFLWERGVASRGKMKGMSFSFPSTEPRPESPACQVLMSRTSRLSTLPETGNETFSTERMLPIGRDSCTIASELTFTLPLGQSVPDPILQNLNHTTRQYLTYFASNLVGFYVYHDLPDNPVRDLISLAANQASPLLLQVLVSNAAYHIHNLSANLGIERPKTTSYTDALTAKMKTLYLLNTMLQNLENASIDVILAAIFFLLDHELLDAGKDSWEVHVKGAQRLIEILDTVTESSNSNSKNLSRIRMYCLSELLVMTILGATFRYPSKSTIIISSSVDLHELLLFTERNNNLSCPAPLLETLLRSMDLPSDPTESMDHESTSYASSSTRELIESLIVAALAFDPAEWLSTFEPSSPSDDLTQRFHIASALRSSVCLFLIRTKAASLLYGVESGNQAPLIDVPAHINQIIYHVSLITPNDAAFQSTLWPVFFVGAETRQFSHRDWVRGRLSALWNHMHWGYIRTTQELLDHIWERRDCIAMNEDRTDPDISWLDEVKKTGIHYLIA